MRVLIDPGHGGEDSGAVAGGLREAAFNLSLAQRCAELFQTFGHWPALTRWRDVPIPLPSRVGLADSLRPDLFLSLHHNAAADETARGFEVWTSAGETAADPLAARILDYAGAVHGLPVRRQAGPAGPDKERDFYVLRRTACPAVLVEAEFLTHPEARAWLGLDANRTALALAIVRGVVAWGAGLVT